MGAISLCIVSRMQTAETYLFHINIRLIRYLKWRYVFIVLFVGKNWNVLLLGKIEYGGFKWGGGGGLYSNEYPINN